MQFAQPLWIVAGLFICLTVFFLQQFLQKKRIAALDQFVSPALRIQLTQNVSSRRRATKKFLYLLAIFCCFLAFARPQYGFKWVEVKRKGIDILFALDTSKSMLAEDIAPNRLERSKFSIMDFVNQLEGDRVGILPFAGSAFLMCPLTVDYSAFEQSLNATNTSVIPKGGTDIATAIESAGSILNNGANHKLLVLITDGENLEGDAVAAAEKAAKKGMRIFTVGVGTKEGELIPASAGGKTAFQKDRAGKFVTSRLDETALARIAEVSDGLYVPLGNRGEGLETIYREKLALIPKEELAERRHKVPLERFEWPLALAIVFLIIELLLGSRKSVPFALPSFLKNIGRHKPKHIVGILLLVATVLYSVPKNCLASQGENAYKEGDFITASQIYAEALEKHPEDFQLHYNYGSAAYKNNLFDDAIASFTTALKSSDLQLQERAYYNRGNAHYKKGMETQQTDPQQTLQQWRESLDSYKASLELQPDSEAARFNHDLVEKKLKELEQEQQQKQDKNQQDKDQESEEKKEDNDTQEGKNQNDSSQESSDTEQKTQNPAKQNQEDNKDHQQQPAQPENKDDDNQQATSKKDKEGKEDEQQKNAANAERRKLGKMTKEEAQQLLDELKNEEGTLNFIPVNDRDDKEPRRNW